MRRFLFLLFVFATATSASFAAEFDPYECLLKCIAKGISGAECRYICLGIGA